MRTKKSILLHCAGRELLSAIAFTLLQEAQVRESGMSGLLPPTSGSKFELRPQAEARSYGQQRVEREVFPLASLDFGHTWLRDTQFFRGFGLRPAFGGDALLNADHYLGPHFENGGFVFIESQVKKDVAAALGNSGVVPAGIGLVHRSFSNQLVPSLRQRNIVQTRLLRLFLEGMKHADRVGKLCHIDHAPRSAEVNPNLIGAFTHFLHWLEVHRHQPVLYPEKFLAKRPADIRRKLPQIVPAAANEVNGLRFHRNDYTNTYLNCLSALLRMGLFCGEGRP